MRRSIRKHRSRNRRIARNQGRGKRRQPIQNGSFLRGFKALRRIRDAFSLGGERWLRGLPAARASSQWPGANRNTEHN